MNNIIMMKVYIVSQMVSIIIIWKDAKINNNNVMLKYEVNKKLMKVFNTHSYLMNKNNTNINEYLNDENNINTFSNGNYIDLK